MKKLFLLTCMMTVIVYYGAFAQTATNTFPLNGNVGIGTMTPSQALDVQGSINLPTTSSSTMGVIYNGTTPLLHTFTATGSDGHNLFLGPISGNFTLSTGGGGSYLASNNVGIGPYTLYNLTNGYDNSAFGVNSLNANTTGFANLGIGSRTLTSNTWGYGNVALGTYSLQQNVGGAYNVAIGYGSGQSQTITLQGMNNCVFIGYRAVSTNDTITNSVAIGASAQVTKSNEVVIGNASTAVTVLTGEVGIGTSTPREALSVNGNIRSKQVKVETANWPDYVFKKEYSLLPLADLKTYIDVNHHLPEIPSEEEIAKDGQNLGEMNKVLVKKVEELTMYLIEKDKESKAQNKRLNKLEEEVKSLKK